MTYVHTRIILKWILEKRSFRVRFRGIWLGTGNSDELVVNMVMKFCVP
jgi:hypothetical protein